MSWRDVPVLTSLCCDSPRRHTLHLRRDLVKLTLDPPHSIEHLGSRCHASWSKRVAGPPATAADMRRQPVQETGCEQLRHKKRVLRQKMATQKRAVVHHRRQRQHCNTVLRTRDRREEPLNAFDHERTGPLLLFHQRPACGDTSRSGILTAASIVAIAVTVIGIVVIVAEFVAVVAGETEERRHR